MEAIALNSWRNGIKLPLSPADAHRLCSVIRGSLRQMGRPMFGEPLGAHPPKIGAPGNTRLVDQRGTDRESCDSE
jgi:hypothetical protein